MNKFNTVNSATEAYTDKPNAQLDILNTHLVNTNDALDKSTCRLEEALKRLGHNLTETAKTNGPAPVPNGHIGLLSDNIKRTALLNERLAEFMTILETYI